MGEKKIDPKWAEEILAEFDEHLRIGVLQLIKIDEERLWNRAILLGRKYATSLLVRSLDVLQVSFALEIEVAVFWTFDDRQKRLAEAVGLKVN